MKWLIFAFIAVMILDTIALAMRAMRGSLSEDMANLGAALKQVDELADRLEEPEKTAVKEMLAPAHAKLEEAKARVESATHAERQMLRAEVKRAMKAVSDARQRALKSLPEDEEDD
ncbi:MAG TPA: hypothetical protein V6D17_21825 [Candidatus Obscuribacterales bacterium]